MIEDFISAMNDWGLDPLRTSDIVPSAESRLIMDSKRKKTIYYQLIIENDKGWGRWYDCRSSEGGSWASKLPRTTSREDRAAWKARIASLEAQAEAEATARAAIAASECTARWKVADKCLSHPYLDRKKVAPVDLLRVEKDLLLIPALDGDGKIRTIQTINADGDKFFVKDGQKKGAFFPINMKKTERYNNIYIVEGLATGLSVAQATASPVAVAFDRGNLYPVAKVVNQEWPEAMIIFAADNDLKPNGRNDGVWSAQQAAGKIGFGHVIAPDTAGQDWNDVAQYDIEQVRTKLVAGLSPLSTAATPEALDQESNKKDGIPVASGDLVNYGETFEEIATLSEVRGDGNPTWFSEFIWEKEPKEVLSSMMAIKGRHDGKSLSNTIIFIRNEFRGMFVMNEFSDELMVMSCPPWMKENDFRVHRLTDQDVVNMTASLEYYGFKPSVERTRQAIESVARLDATHPPRNYFSKLEWDGNHRLGLWLKYYCGAIHQPDEYLSRIGTMWMVAAVKRVFEPGAVFHNMLVLEGKTNIGKSRTLRELATFGRDIEEEYFTDAIRFRHIDKPSALQILQGKLIVEFAELADMDNESDESLKAWITQNSDEMIKKWEKYPTKYPRQFVLAGTTNNDTWLRDPTGNRRYWPVRCTSFRHDEIKRDKEQLWAEAVHLYREDYSVTMPDDDPAYAYAKLEQAARLVDDPWEDAIDKGVGNRMHVSYDDIYNILGLTIKERDKINMMVIRKIMSKNGWEYKQSYSTTGSKNKVWVR